MKNNIEYVIYSPFPIPTQTLRYKNIDYAKRVLCDLIDEARKRKDSNIYIDQMELRANIYAPWHNRLNDKPLRVTYIWSGVFHGAEALDDCINKFKWEVGLKDE